ncbi:MAG: carboxypeptidase-like regulatory domain-containing protein [Flavobacteriaceae bacterium]
MKKIVFIFISILSFQLSAQITPKVVLKDSSELKLKSLDINIKVVGNSAITIYDMKFYNELDRILEGELVFPLGQNQSVSGFAMDVNGKLRESVVVEKELARVAYETTVRQNIDPGLLEKTSGNNYKARVYPILPKKGKNIVLTYEETLFATSGNLIYELPLGIQERIDNVTINIEVFGANQNIKIDSKEFSSFSKKKTQGGISFSVSKDNVSPKSPITIHIPKVYDKEKVLVFRDYFYVHTFLQPKSREKKKPKRVTVLWDASYSLKDRNVKKELKLLGEYMTYLGNVTVDFITFSDDVVLQKKIKIDQGDWSELEKQILSIKYDGGTNFNQLSKVNIKADEILLFSDGMDNLGGMSSIKDIPVYAINSTTSSNHFSLENLAIQSAGAYINLVRLSVNQGKELLFNETFQFLGIKKNDALKEVYPKSIVNVLNDFVIAGRFSKETSIELEFGYGGKVTETKTVDINNSANNALVRRLWAKQKLNYLNFEKENNKKEIIQLAKQYKLITDYTSLLILDRIEDYVRYEIEPPLELRQRYKQLLKAKKKRELLAQKRLERSKQEIFDSYKNIRKWYDKDFKVKKKTKITYSAINDTIAGIIKGFVKDQSNSGLPGVNIVIKGTMSGAETDLDGKYEIEANLGDVLVFSNLGYVTKEVRVGLNSVINVALEEDGTTLDEVVVTMDADANRIMNFSAPAVVNNNRIYALKGFVSGLSTTRDFMDVIKNNETDTIFNSTPIFVIDAKIASYKEFKKLTSDKIDGIQVYKPKDAMKVYGEKGRKGLVVIVTKKGREKNAKAIEAFEKMIKEKVELKAWNPKDSYIDILKKETNVASAYKKYIEIRKQYANIPMFYVDVADFFHQKKATQLATRILTNLIEIDIDNYELIKVLAYKLEDFKQYDLAVKVYQKILELRPEDVQSYRDLALAYEYAGEYQKSFNLLYKIYNSELLEKDIGRRFKGVEQICFVEISRLVSKYGHKLSLTKNQKSFFKKIPVDVRVVIDWNHNDTDIDLWVIDPRREKASYKNKKTRIGGRMSDDMTDGFGPEEFLLKKAIKGEYLIKVNYYSDNIQKISGPAILKVNLFKNYGRSNETRETFVLRLDKKSDKIEVGKLIFD